MAVGRSRSGEAISRGCQFFQNEAVLVVFVNCAQFCNAHKRSTVEQGIQSSEKVVRWAVVGTNALAIAEVHRRKIVIIFVAAPGVTIVLADGKVEEDESWEGRNQSKIEVALLFMALEKIVRIFLSGRVIHPHASYPEAESWVVHKGYRKVLKFTNESTFFEVRTFMDAHRGRLSVEGDKDEEKFEATDFVMVSAFVSDVFRTIEDELTIFAVDQEFSAFWIVMLPDVSISFLRFRAVRAEVMFELMLIVFFVIYDLMAIRTVDL